MEQEERDRLTVIETETKIRWDNHDKRSEEIWKEVKGSIKAIFIKLDNLQCQTHAEKHRGHNKQITWLWRLGSAMVIAIISRAIWIIATK